MARRRSFRRRARRYIGRRSKGMTIPMTVAAPLVASFMTSPAYGLPAPVNAAMSSDWNGLGRSLTLGWTGFDPELRSFNWTAGLTYTKMMLVGGIVHLLAGKLGVNRALGRAGIPVIRV